MKISIIKNESYEDPGLISDWAKERSFEIKIFEAYNHSLPELGTFDLLIILGGSVSVNDNLIWLKEEIEFLSLAIKQKSLIFGICLGAQLLSKCLGGTVVPNPVKEIGWYEISCPVNFLKDKLKVLHWHSETFSIPPGAELLASSYACKNQAFSFGDNILGLQFHLETNLDSIKSLIKNTQLDHSNQYVQSESEILRLTKLNIEDCREELFDLLDGLEMRLSPN